MVSWIHDFSNTYKSATGRAPVIYTTFDCETISSLCFDVTLTTSCFGFVHTGWNTCTGNSGGECFAPWFMFGELTNLLTTLLQHSATTLSESLVTHLPSVAVRTSRQCRPCTRLILTPLPPFTICSSQQHARFLLAILRPAVSLRELLFQFLGFGNIMPCC